MQQTAEFRGLAETRWGTSSGNFTDSSVTTTRVEGSEGAIPGGIAGGLPGQLPNVVENFTFEPRSSGGGGAGIDPGAERVRLTIIPESGNNNGPIWCGAVIQATDENGNFLLFDVTTKGS